MKLLLDTHALIWFLDGSERISGRARTHIEKNGNTSYISIASIWEMAIKLSLNKLQMTMPFETLKDYITDNGFQILPLRFDHALQVSRLPFHHRDPFDRIIIAQGMVEKMPLLSADHQFDHYAIERIW